MHFDPQDPIAPAGLATATFNVKAETTRTVAPPPCLCSLGKQFADTAEQPRISSRIGTRVLPIGDWSTTMTLSRCSTPSRARWRQPAGGNGAESVPVPGENFIDQGCSCRSRRLQRHKQKGPRDLHVNILQVMFASTPDPESALVRQTPLLRYSDAPPPGKIIPGDRARGSYKIVNCSLGHDLHPRATPAPGPISTI